MGKRDELIARAKNAAKELVWLMDAPNGSIWLVKDGTIDESAHNNPAEIIEDLTAEVEALHSVAVCAAVKPLEWEAGYRDQRRADSPVGEFCVTFFGGRWFYQGEPCEGMLDAQAAAQADYEHRILSALTLRSEAEVAAEAWRAAIEAAASRCRTTENVVGGILSRLDDALAPEHGGVSMHARGQTPDWFVEAARESCYLVSDLSSLTPPADISAALDAIKDVAWDAGAEAMREAVSHALYLCDDEEITDELRYVISDLPVPERKK